MTEQELNKMAVKLAKEIVAMPLVYEYIYGIKFYLYKEDHCQHYEPHVHIKEGKEEATFSLRDGHCLITDKKPKHYKEIIDFLKDTSNRRRLLRRYKKLQETNCCEVLVNPNL